MPYYEYKPIHHLQHAFRLVHLCGGARSEVSCHLVHASLEEELLMPYEALSYTWGVDPDFRNINVDGQNMMVTANLHSALIQLRHPNQDRILWIGAVCINQGNDYEKSHQVQQMRSIYHKAEQVIIWLGDSSKSTTILMESLALFQKAVRGMSLGLATKDKWMAAWRLTEAQVLCHRSRSLNSHTEGLRALLRRPWFRRCWVIQEVANARRATVYCGQNYVSSKIFAISPVLLDIEADQHCDSILELMAGPSNRPRWWSEGRSLFTLVYKFADAYASIGRDKIYALLGLVDEGFTASNHLPVDYAVPEDVVVERAVTAMFGKPPDTVQLPSSVLDLTLRLEFISMKILEDRLASNLMMDAEFLFQTIQHAMPITDRMIEAAVVSAQVGPAMMRLILQHNRVKMEISGSIMAIILRQEDAKLIMQSIIQSLGMKAELKCQFANMANHGFGETVLEVTATSAQFTITSYMLKMAAEHQRGDRLLVELLKYLPKNITIGASVLEAAIENEHAGAQSLQILLDHRAERYQVSCRTVQSALEKDPQILRLLVDCVNAPRQSGSTTTKPSQVTSDGEQSLLKNARYRKAIVATLSHRSRIDHHLVPDVMMQIVSDPVSGCRMLCNVVQRAYREITISLLLLHEIASNITCRRQMFETLIGNAFVLQNNWLTFVVAAKRQDLGDLRELLFKHTPREHIIESLVPGQKMPTLHVSGLHMPGLHMLQLSMLQLSIPEIEPLQVLSAPQR